MNNNLLAMKFSKALKARREKIGLTQQGLAFRCCLSPDWISHFECGRRLPSLETFAKLVQAVQGDANQMLGL